MKTYNRSALVFLFSITYLISYITRINFGAVISEIGTVTGFSKQELSYAVTGSFITYGLGQIFSGILGDRLLPKKLVFFGLFVTTAMNIFLPLCSTPWQMTVIWSINGLAQAFMWPPILRLMIALFRGDRYKVGVVRIGWGSSLGTILIYLISPLIITLFGWKGVFYFSGICSAVMMIFWNKYCPAIRVEKKNKTIENNNSNMKIFTPVFCIILLIISIIGVLRDGVATWTPSLISETFDLSNNSGILSGAVMPIFGMICYEIALKLYKSKFTNPIVCAGVIYLLGAISSLGLIAVFGKSSIGAILFIAILNGSMHGTNLMFISMLPAFYAKSGIVSTISGILNAFVYLGSAISTYGGAVITENFGWNVTIYMWLGLAIMGTVLSFIIAKPWKKQIEKS